MGRPYILFGMLGLTAILTYSAIAQERASATGSSGTAVEAQASTQTTGTTARDTAEERALRLEGEKRFRTNCGRCHQAPHKFPPRVMAAAIRHMRVRATITDEDMRLILRYMTR